MSKAEFDKFVEVQSTRQEAEKIDWNKRRDEWINQLGEFYEQVDHWLSEYTEAGTIIVSKCNLNITEDYLGEYSAPMRTIKIGPDVAILRPIGTLILGARGRIDLEGPNGIVKFIYTGKHSNGLRISAKIITPNKEPAPAPEKVLSAPGGKETEKEEYVWKIVTSPPNIQFIELDQDMFFDALTKVLNG